MFVYACDLTFSERIKVNMICQSYGEISKHMILREKGSIAIKNNLICSYGCHHQKGGNCEDKLPTCFD